MSALSPLLFVVVMQEATRAARGEVLWNLLYANDLVITVESEEEAVRILVYGKKEMETRGLKGRGRLEQTQYGVNVVKGGAPEMFGAQKSEKSRR